MVERALLDFDSMQSLLAAKQRRAALTALRRVRRRIRELPAVERQQGEALLKLGEQLLRDFDQKIALQKKAEEQRQLLTAECAGCGRSGSGASLTKDSGRFLCHACRQRITAKCAGCGRTVSKIHMTTKSGSPRCNECHQQWANPKCSKCGKPFKRHPSMPRQRVCDLCGGGQRSSLRTVSGGLPTLGRRR
jgi:DNA-directed RNA polymerase subunit RPC12/RpoP